MSVFVADEQKEAVGLPDLHSLAEMVLREEGYPTDAEVTLLFVDETEIASYNGRFLDREGPTDVLAFPYDPGQSEGVLGDVYVSLERATAQAEERREPVARGGWRLFVHGALHLAGHMHDSAESEREMIRIQEEWVARLPGR